MDDRRVGVGIGQVDLQGLTTWPGLAYLIKRLGSGFFKSLFN